MDTRGMDYYLKLRADGRYNIVDPVTEQVLHDGNRFGYTTLAKARNAAEFLCKGGQEVKADTGTVDLLDILVYSGVSDRERAELAEEPEVLWVKPKVRVYDSSKVLGVEEYRAIKERIAGVLWAKAEQLVVRQVHVIDGGKELVYVDELGVYVSRKKVVNELLYAKKHGQEFSGW